MSSDPKAEQVVEQLHAVYAKASSTTRRDADLGQHVGYELVGCSFFQLFPRDYSPSMRSIDFSLRVCSNIMLTIVRSLPRLPRQAFYVTIPQTTGPEASLVLGRMPIFPLGRLRPLVGVPSPWRPSRASRRGSMIG